MIDFKGKYQNMTQVIVVVDMPICLSYCNTGTERESLLVRVSILLFYGQKESIVERFRGDRYSGSLYSLF